jgi:O-antigen/teichoic acid export membrane protein
MLARLNMRSRSTNPPISLLMTDLPTAAISGSDNEDYLATQHLRTGIKTRTLSGAIASTGAQAGQLLLILSYNAILARLVSPHDFGLVAMAMVVAGFLQVFKEAGLSTATIQREDITQAQVSNLFWINLSVGFTAMVALSLMSPMIAWFFHQPELLGISAVLSIAFLVDGSVVQHVALLNRQMRFQMISYVELGSAAAGFLLGAVMALNGWGYWSLVVATLTTSVIRATTVWVLSPWRPQRFASKSGTWPLLKFGVDLTLVGVIYALSRGFDSILIGRYLGSDALGVYSRGIALITRPLERLIAPVYSVMVPALSRLQTEPERYRKAFLQVFEALAVSAFAIAGLLLAIADPLVLVILGDRWTAASPILAALSPAVIHIVLGSATSWLYTSQGRGTDLVRTASIGAALLTGSFILGLNFGATGVAAAYSASGLALLPITFYVAGRTGPVSTRDLWLAAAGHLPVFMVVLSATLLSASYVPASFSNLARLLFSTAVGATAAAAATFVFGRSRRAAGTVLATLANHVNRHHD